jgi:hypothetical protein
MVLGIRETEIFKNMCEIRPTVNIDKSVFVNNQLDAQFFVTYVYFYSLHISGNHVSIIGRINCINTTSRGMSLCIDERLVCRFG